MSLVARIICWLIWGFLLISNVFYVFTATMTQQRDDSASWSDFAALMLKIAFVNVGIAVLLFITARLLLHFVRNPKIAPFISNGALPVLALFAWVLCQACSIYGLIIFFQTTQLIQLFVFMGIAVSGLILLNPFFFYWNAKQNKS